MTVTLIGNSTGSAGENRIHPGSGRRKAHIYNKGRQLDPVAFEEVKSLFQQAPQRDMLIEYLHSIQDSFGCLHARHLRGLAEWMRLSMAETYEVATFYAAMSRQWLRWDTIMQCRQRRTVLPPCWL